MVYSRDVIEMEWYVQQKGIFPHTNNPYKQTGEWMAVNRPRINVLIRSPLPAISGNYGVNR